MNKVIFFVAGGTGGHLFPAIAAAKSFKKSQSHFIVDKRTEIIIYLKYLFHFLKSFMVSFILFI